MSLARIPGGRKCPHGFGSQQVVGLVQMSDLTWWSASAEVEVTESACLDVS